MKYLKLFESFDRSKIEEALRLFLSIGTQLNIPRSINHSDKKKRIDMWIKRNFTIDEKGFVNKKGDLYVNSYQLKDGKLPLKFGKVTGDFIFKDCPNLTSLEGSPEWVRGKFYCGYTKLTNLIGGPKWVGGTFDCSYSHLQTLEGAPDWVGSDFGCNNNYLESLEFLPKGCKRIFCSHNKIKTLSHLPKIINADLDVSTNELTMIDGPTEIHGDFCVRYNPLKTLKGCPKVDGALYVPYNLQKEINLAAGSVLPAKWLINQDIFPPFNDDGSLNTDNLKLLVLARLLDTRYSRKLVRITNLLSRTVDEELLDKYLRLIIDYTNTIDKHHIISHISNKLPDVYERMREISDEESRFKVELNKDLGDLGF